LRIGFHRVACDKAHMHVIALSAFKRAVIKTGWAPGAIRASTIRFWQVAQPGRSMALSKMPKCENGDLDMRTHLFLFQARAQHSQSPGTTYAGR
jgi:hypothetical protein